MIDFTAMLKHMIEYAPAVAALLWLQYRADRRWDRFFNECLKHLLKDAAVKESER